MLHIQRLCAICFLYFRIELLKPLDILECRMTQNALIRLDAQVGGRAPANLAVNRDIFLGVPRPVEGHGLH